MNQLSRINKILTSYFAVLVIVVSIIAYLFPTVFLAIKPHIAFLLGIIMFGMGMTLKFDDFKIAFVKPVPIIIGVTLQFLVMPALGFLLAILLKLPPEIAAGVVLVGACPGGTASNVMVYLSRGNVALSVAMTTISTLLAPILTPYLILFYAQRWLLIDPIELFLSILKIVLVPVVIGLLVKKFLPKIADKAEKLTPFVSVLAIIAIIACVVALNVENIITMGIVIFLAVVLHNLLGLLLGYVTARIFKQERKNCRAISIEVGMQNSGLGAALAHTHFSPVTALPSAIFSIWHNISGAILASIWSRKS
ncbi:MAG: bile acid:sodium symporter family protein [Candidatus Theseobacter exili]|nr:bile acid:sodium symporter family protein [Candidatus Theseobacter exili]